MVIHLLLLYLSTHSCSVQYASLLPLKLLNYPFWEFVYPFTVGIKCSQQKILGDFFEAKCCAVLRCKNLTVMFRDQAGLCFWFSAGLSILVSPHYPTLFLSVHLLIPLPYLEHCILPPTLRRTLGAERVSPRGRHTNETNGSCMHIRNHRWVA